MCAAKSRLELWAPWTEFPGLGERAGIIVDLGFGAAHHINK